MFVLFAVLGRFVILLCTFLIKFSLVKNQEAKTLGLHAGRYKYLNSNILGKNIPLFSFFPFQYI